MPKEIQDNLLNFIAETFFVEKDEIDLEESLVAEGIIDSMGLIEIAAYIEKEFFIAVQEDQMTRENFGSVVKIVNFIKKEINSRDEIKHITEDKIAESAGG